MTTLIIGPDADALAEARKLGATLFFPSDFVDEDKKKSDREFALRWNSRSLPPAFEGFVDPPPAINPTGLAPRRDRLVVFTDGALPKPWEKWAEGHGEKVKLLKVGKTPEQITRWLAGGPKGLPKFTPQAAKFIVESNPGGLQAIRKAVETCALLNLPEPITYEDVVEVWPFVPKVGRVYVIKTPQLMKALGTPEAIRLAAIAPEGESHGALKYLEKACARRPDQIELLEPILNGVKELRWRSKPGLVLFTHLCYWKAVGWRSKSTTKPSLSPPLDRLCQLLDIP